jgi:hypothetical protein
LPVMPNLKELDIGRCRNLETLAALPIIAPNLEKLVVTACGKVSDGKLVVTKLSKLKHAYVRDELLVKNKEFII